YGTAAANFLAAIAFFFSSRRRHTRSLRDWSSDVCSSDLQIGGFSESDSSNPPIWLIRVRCANTVGVATHALPVTSPSSIQPDQRSEERRVGKECRSRWST